MGWPDVIFFCWITCGIASAVLTIHDYPNILRGPFDYGMLLFGVLWGPVTLLAALTDRPTKK